MNFEEIIDSIVPSLESACGSSGKSVLKEARISTYLGFVASPDLLITNVEGEPLIVFEIKADMQLGVNKDIDKGRKLQLHREMDLLGVLYGVLTNGLEFVFARIDEKGKCNYDEIDLDSLLDLIRHIDEYAIPVVSGHDLMQGLADHLSTFSKVETKYVDYLSECVDSVNVSNTYFSLSPEKEIGLLQLLIGKPDSNRFCRYISSSSLFRTIKDQEDSMCGLAVMNDKSECYFLDTLLKRNCTAKLSDKTNQEIDELNRCFINSLCKENREDELTMWRLYGSDGKGVCVEYEVLDSKLNAGSNFYMMNVNYTDENSRSNALKLVGYLMRSERIRGYKFTFTQYDVWKHFFKSIAFKAEEEVRLLYQKPSTDLKGVTEKWIYNSDYQIAHPIIVFDRSQTDIYPLKMTKIIFGPKFPEIDTNIPQFKKLLRWKSMTGIEVVPSAIKFYR